MGREGSSFSYCVTLRVAKKTHSMGPLRKRGAFWSLCGPWRPTLPRPPIEWGVLATLAFWLHRAVEIVEFGPLTDALRRELEGDESDPFDASGITLHFQPKDRHVGLRDDAGRLVASTGIVMAEVEVDHERFSVVGLGGVIVTAQYRGRGLGRQVVQAALAKATKLGPAFALLFCHEDRAGLYRKLGFSPVDAEVVVWQAAGYVSMTQQTMWRPLHGAREWPPGDVVVHSLPF